MSSVVSGIRLYDYRGNYRVMPPLDTNQTISTPQTNYTASLDYNGNVSAEDFERYMNTSLTVDRNGQLTQSTPQSQQAMMAFGQQTYRSTSNVSYESVTNPYQDWMAALNISEQNFADLKQTPQYSIYNGAVGVTVVNGPGGTQEVSINTATKDTRAGMASNVGAFPDRAAITEGAVPLLGSQLPPTLVDPNSQIFLQQKGGPKQVGLKANLDNQFDARFKAAPVKVSFDPKPVMPYETPADLSSNPLLQKLLSLQPREVDVTVFGPDARISAENAKKIGTVNASYGVEHSAEFKENLAVYREKMAQQAQEITPQRVVQARDGKMPLASQMPMEAPSNQNPFMNNGGSQNFQMMASTDTTDKKSAGGYIPFRMGQDGGAGYQGSSSQQGQSRSRKPLYAMA